MAALTIRSATRDDLPAIVALLADDVLGRARERPTDLSVYQAAFIAIAANPQDGQFVAEHAGRIVGCFQLTFVPGLSHGGAWRGQIESVRIAAAQRGAGLGSQMVGWASSGAASGAAAPFSSRRMQREPTPGASTKPSGSSRATSG